VVLCEAVLCCGKWVFVCEAVPYNDSGWFSVILYHTVD